MKYLILTEGSIGPRKDKNCSKHSPRTESKNNCHTNKTYPRVHYSSIRFSLRFACGGKCVCSLALFSFLLFEVRKSGTKSAIAPSLGYPAALVVDGVVDKGENFAKSAIVSGAGVVGRGGTGENGRNLGGAGERDEVCSLFPLFSLLPFFHPVFSPTPSPPPNCFCYAESL